MSFKIGQKVRVIGFDIAVKEWHNCPFSFNENMLEWCGKTVTLKYCTIPDIWIVEENQWYWKSSWLKCDADHGMEIE